MSRSANSLTEIRLAELVAALSIATDLGMGQPLEFALCGCVLAMRLGEALRLDETQLRAVYYQALLRYIGCNAETDTLAALFGDEMEMRKEVASVDTSNTLQSLNMILHFVKLRHDGASMLELMWAMTKSSLTVPQTTFRTFKGHCEVAQRLAERLGFDSDIIQALGQLYERWDGRGKPNELKGEAVATSVLIVTLAQDVVTFQRLGGNDAAIAMVKERAGHAYAPYVAECFLQQSDHLLAGLDQEQSWETVLALEPGKRLYLTEEQLDNACEVLADFADIKSPFTGGHSRHVATLVEAAARQAGLAQSDVTQVQRAALLHDLGKVGITTAIWTKTGSLNEREWEQVRMHTYYTERVLARSKGLAQLGQIAGLHHERLDGSGYHRGAKAAMLSPTARLLAAANRYQSLLEERSHRPAQTAEEAAHILQLDVREGKLDADAVKAVLSAAGHHVNHSRREMTGGLSAREIEVLRLIARGNTIKQMAKLLTISEKTVDNHIQHIYAKIGVTTRAGATLYAIEQDLLMDAPK
jgi:HD-GYP domain-containing protein (c-di-GMP phosphodiesterase class II)